MSTQPSSLVVVISPRTGLVPYVHVYDHADLCIKSITDAAAHGQRVIASGGKVSFAQMADILRKTYPNRLVPPCREDGFCLDFPDSETTQWDTMLGTRMLGGSWRAFEEAVLSSAEGLVQKEQRGWDLS